MKYKIKIIGKGAELFLYELSENQHQLLLESGVEGGDPDQEVICDILNVESLFDAESEFCLYENEFEVDVFDENENHIYTFDYDYDYVDTKSEYLLDSGYHLIVEDYQKGHFFEIELEVEEFKPELFKLINTEYCGQFSYITGFEYDGQRLDVEFMDTYSKGIYYRLS